MFYCYRNQEDNAGGRRIIIERACRAFRLVVRFQGKEYRRTGYASWSEAYHSGLELMQSLR